jgi:SAM-dependent methyltransferase
MKMNPWDQLSNFFIADDDLSKIDPDVADNVLIAWPSLLKGIQLIQQNGASLHALDYGCGGGAFCQELSQRGYSIAGCDSSSAMIEIANTKYSNDESRLRFYHCDSEKIHQLPNAPFDLITSIMVISFIDQMEPFFSNVNNALKSGGVLALAVFNPDYVLKNHGEGKCFSGFETATQFKNGFLHFGKNIQLPVFIRTLEEYDAQLISRGYERIFTDTPAFTTEYLTQYKTESDTSSPEFLILVYQKMTDPEMVSIV